MRKHPQRFFGDRCGNPSRDRSGKAPDNSRGRATSKLLRCTFAGLQPVRRPPLGAIQAPAPQDDRRPRVLASRWLRGQAGSRVGNPGRQGEQTCPPSPGLFVDRAMYLWASAPRRPLAVALSNRPQVVDGRRGRIKEVSYYNRDALRDEGTGQEGNHVSGGVCSATVANVVRGRWHQATRGNAVSGRT